MDTRPIPARVMLRALASFSLFALPLAPAICLAQGKVFAGDDRLKRPVTVRQVDAPLAAVLAEISQSAGVKLSLSERYDDRAINVRVKDLPVAALLDSIAQLYGDEWKAEGDAKQPGYVFYPSDDRRRRERLLTAAYRRVVREVIASQAEEWATNGPGEEFFAGEPPGPERDRFAGEVKGRGEVIRSLPDSLVDRLFAGEHHRIRLTEPGVDPTLRSFADNYGMPIGADTEFLKTLDAEFSVRVETCMVPVMYGVPLHQICFRVGNAAFGVNALPDKLARSLLMATRPIRGSEEQDTAERRAIGGEQVARRLPEAPLPPAAGRDSAGNMLVAMADAANVNLVADSHTKRFERPAIAPGSSVESALNAVCDQVACYWRTDGRTIRVRSRWWWLDDAAEPPAAARAAWDKMLDQTGVLPLGEAIRIALLSSTQQERLALRIPETSTAFSPWLRFYAALSPMERKAAESEKGIRFTALSPAARAMAPIGSTDDEEEILAEGAMNLTVRMQENAETLLTNLPKVRVPRLMQFRLDRDPEVQGRQNRFHRLLGRGFIGDVALPFRPKAADSANPLGPQPESHRN